METSRISKITTILFGGLGVAIFVFVANKIWEAYSFRDLGPKYVTTSMRFERDTLFLFIRNNSDEPLDIIESKIKIANLDDKSLGTYPDVSKLYDVSSLNSTELSSSKDTLIIGLRIIQAIDPGKADQFGIKLEGLFGPVDLSKAYIRAELYDTEKNTYISIY